MYGNLEKIDVSSLLKFISEQQRNGIFFIETELPNQVEKSIYFLFFSQGHLRGINILLIFNGLKNIYFFSIYRINLITFNKI